MKKKKMLKKHEQVQTQYQKATPENKAEIQSVKQLLAQISFFPSNVTRTFWLWSVVKLPCNTNSKNLRCRF